MPVAPILNPKRGFLSLAGVVLTLGILQVRGETPRWAGELEMANGQLTARVAPEIGRVTHLSIVGGENLLRRDVSLIGSTEPPSGRWAWNNHGGDWLWPVAQDRWDHLGVEKRWPPPAVFAYAPWTAETRKDGSLRMWVEVGEPLHIRVERVLSFVPDDPRMLVVDQSITRTAPSDIPVCLWQVAQMSRPELVEMEVPADSRHADGYRHIQGPAPKPVALERAGNTLKVSVEDLEEGKFGTDGAWILGRSPNGALRIEVENGDDPGELPDGGCSLAMALRPEYAELETMSVERNLGVGERLANRVRMVVP